MSAMLQTFNAQQYKFRPMNMTDLDAIMEIEPLIYSHPWTRGNFSDSLNSGYSAWVLEKNNEMIGQKHYEHNEMIHGELVCDEVGI
jgi:ribosomal-protein-alanine N-acetyltransferase